jgi:hypothetical protein
MFLRAPRPIASTLFLSKYRLGKDAPLGRHIERSGTIVTTPILSGLHHRYARI